MTQRRGWDIQGDSGTVQVARRGRTRLDFSAATDLAATGKLRVAQEVRQDIWRALQHQRGFTPIVKVTKVDGGLNVIAGGMVSAKANLNKLTQDVQSVLSNPEKRARWARHA